MNYELSPIWKEFETAEINLLKQLKEKVKEQRELWQKIPALAWVAEQYQSKHSTSLLFRKVARHGLWPVCHKNLNWYADMWIDCESGLILNVHTLKEVEPLELRPLWGKLHELDPSIVHKRLYFKIKGGYSFEELTPCPISDPYRRTTELPSIVDTQLVESTD